MDCNLQLYWIPDTLLLFSSLFIILIDILYMRNLQWSPQYCHTLKQSLQLMCSFLISYWACFQISFYNLFSHQIVKLQIEVREGESHIAMRQYFKNNLVTHCPCLICCQCFFIFMTGKIVIFPLVKTLFWEEEI